MRGKGKTFAAQPGIYSALRDRGVSQAAARQAEYEKAGERMKTKTKKQREIRNNATAWALMAPALIFMLAFTVFPIFRSLYLSLSKYKLGMDGAEFIGLENYVKLAGSKLFWKVMKNTIVFALMTVIPSMAVGLGLAVLVNRKGKRVGFIRTAYFYPVVMPMIAIASVWMFIYMAKNGLFDQLLIAIGLKPMNVLSSKSTVLPAMAVMYVWKEAGYLMVFFLSGIQSISDEVMEAARIDGANKMQTFIQVVLPLVAPGVVATAIYTFINTWNEFLYALILMNNTSKMTVAVALRSLDGAEILDWGDMMAASALVVLPSVIFFCLIQNKIAGGMSDGAVKS